MIERFLCFLVSAVGGGSFVSILLNQPIPFLQSDTLIIIYLATFVILQLSFGLPLYRHPLVHRLSVPLHLLNELFFINSITSAGVDRCASLPAYQHSAFYSILCGFLSGFGGFTIRSLFALTEPPQQWRFVGFTSQYQKSTVKPLTFAILYWITTNPQGKLPFVLAGKWEIKVALAAVAVAWKWWEMRQSKANANANGTKNSGKNGDNGAVVKGQEKAKENGAGAGANSPNSNSNSVSGGKSNQNHQNQNSKNGQSGKKQQ